MSERAALLALLLKGDRPWSAVADDVEERGSALAALTEGASGQLTFVSEADGELAAAEDMISNWENEGLRFVSLLDPQYPQQLLTIHQRPPFIMTRGLPSIHDAQGVAIVGTREASDEGRQRAHDLAYKLAGSGVTVISGLAAGIDTAAHTGALDAGGRTVAVIGTGLRRSYPAANRSLQERIGETGMVLSQFLPDAPPTKHSFPMRNAIMSGYASATVVVEAAWRSGARMQARLALEHGRRVFLLNSLLEHDWAREYAQRPGVAVVEAADEVEDSLHDLSSTNVDLVWA
jgi:DNA processing protein